MKLKLAAAAVLAGATVVAAHAGEVSELKKETRALRKHNHALEQKLKRIERRQRVAEERSAARREPAPIMAGPIHKGPLEFLTDDGPITWHGITLYGALDAGVSYLAHGNAPNPYAGWSNSLITKASGNPRFTTAPNGLSFSNIGLKGDIPIMSGLSGVFNINTAFNPMSGQIVDGLGSMVKNNGLPLYYQNTNGDSSRAGQPLNTLYYAGLSSPVFGTLTFGRQNTLTLDTIIGYDPTGAALDFSPLGFSGVAAGAGYTEDARLDNTIKYRFAYGPLHAAAMYKFGSNGMTDPHDAYQLNLGFEYMGFAMDAVYSRINGAVAAAPLSLAQLNGVTVAGAPTYTAMSFYGTPIGTYNTLAGIASDNRAFMLGARYTFNQFQFFGGYENIRYSNPGNPLGAGYTTIGGYTLSYMNNNAYTQGKSLQIMWAGAKYAFNPQFDVTLSYYHYIQGAYYTPFNKASMPTTGCAGTYAAGTCAGTLDAVSLYADYRFTKRFDVYAGMMYSKVSNGLASGYLHTYNYNPTLGVRYQF
ncbi:MAG: porin [Hyphomicrobiales bacterium]|nr:porin [Hyphomicrobiales bacterium]